MAFIASKSFWFVYKSKCWDSLLPGLLRNLAILLCIACSLIYHTCGISYFTEVSD
jgi:hypothetical protein